MDSVFLTILEHDKGKLPAADPAIVDNLKTLGGNPNLLQLLSLFCKRNF